MTELAIRGHATRGKEIIELLEMLGGKNKDDFHFFHNTAILSFPSKNIFEEPNALVNGPVCRFGRPVRRRG